MAEETVEDLDTLVDEAQEEINEMSEPVAPEDGEQVEESAEETPAPEPEEDTAARLEALEKELSTAQKRYDDLRPLMDRKATENTQLGEQVQTLQQQIQQMYLNQSQQQRGVDAATARREHDELAEKWRKQLAEEPERAFDLVQQVGLELQGEMDSRLKQVEEAYERKLAELQTGLKKVDPEYQQLKDRVETLANDYGMSLENALKFARDEASSKGVAQPGKSPAPEPKKTNRTATPAPVKTPVSLRSVPAAAQLAADLGLDPKEIASLEAELGA